MKIISFFIIIMSAMIVALMGWLIKYKKKYWLISGYNTMSAEKKKKVNIDGLSRFIATVCFVISGVLIIASVFSLLNLTSLSLINFALLFPIAIFTIIKAQQFDQNAVTSDGKMQPKTKKQIAFIVGFLILMGVGVSVLLIASSKPASYQVDGDYLRISGMYGQDISIDEITSLELTDELPAILAKTNGSAIGNKYKGHFKLNDVGSALLFIDTANPPFIVVMSENQTIIFNSYTPEETASLYEQIASKCSQ